MLEIVDKVIAGIKAVREIADKTKNAELQNQIAELSLATADLKMEVAELKSEITRLRDENVALKRRNDIRSKTLRRDNLLYLKEGDSACRRGPFCAICYEVDTVLIAVSNISRNANENWYCPRCEKQVC